MYEHYLQNKEEKQSQSKQPIQETSGISNQTIYSIIGILLIVSLVFMRYRKGKRKKGSKKGSKKGEYKSMFMNTATMAAGTISGLIAGFLPWVLWSVFFIFFGWPLIKNNNIPGTKLFKDIQTQQWVGIVLSVIGLLPWLEFFFIPFVGAIGRTAGYSIADEF